MKHPRRIGRAARLVLVIPVVVLAGGIAGAAQLVTFSRGQSIVVQSSEYRGGWYYFVLEGGGEVGVPADRVAKIEDYEAAPAVPPAAAPGAAAAPAPAAQPAQPGPAPAVSANSPGSGPQAAQPAAAPGHQPPSQPNVASQGSDDWRYKARMSGGPHQLTPSNPYGMAGAKTAPGGGRLPPGGGPRPGGLGRVIPYPPQPQQQTPTN